MPCTASNNSLHCEDNPLWNKNNLEKYALDYTSFDKTKSSDSNYSSTQDAKQISLEELSKHPHWKIYDIKEVSRKVFMDVTPKYKGKDIDELTDKDIDDIDRRRKLEFCKFMENDKEKEAMKNGLNC